MSRIARVLAAVVAAGAVTTAGVLIGWPVGSESAPLPGDEELPAVIAERAPVTDAPPAADTIRIPALRIEARVVPTAVRAGQVAVPSDPAVVGLAESGAGLCSEAGTALLVGHVVNGSVRGALWPLAATKPGMLLRVGCADGRTRTYRAAGTAVVVPKGTLPTALATIEGPPGVAIVTCGGPVGADGHYVDNVLVTFDEEV